MTSPSWTRSTSAAGEGELPRVAVHAVRVGVDLESADGGGVLAEARQRQTLLGDDLAHVVGEPRQLAPVGAGQRRRERHPTSTRHRLRRSGSLDDHEPLSFVSFGAPRLAELADDALVGRTELDPPPLQLGLDRDAVRLRETETLDVEEVRTPAFERLELRVELADDRDGVGIERRTGYGRRPGHGERRRATTTPAAPRTKAPDRGSDAGDREQERERDEEGERPQPAQLVRREAEHSRRRRRRREEAAQQAPRAHDARGGHGAVAPAPGEAARTARDRRRRRADRPGRAPPVGTPLSAGRVPGIVRTSSYWNALAKFDRDHHDGSATMAATRRPPKSRPMPSPSPAASASRERLPLPSPVNCSTSGCAQQRARTPAVTASQRPRWGGRSGDRREQDDDGHRGRQPQRGHEIGVGEVRLEEEAAESRHPRQGREVAGAGRPRRDQCEQEREQEAVRLPRVEQQLAAHRPGETGCGDHGEHDGARPADAAGEHGDADDAEDVDDRDADGQADVAVDLGREGVEVEQERTGVVDVDAEGLRRRGPRAEQRVMRR